ncbi:MAG: helix-turn-helix domain-containing protein [Desulfobacteraceae bacterium]|nr:helix-turn-helix domain-containing protein [Desulfobacteraceae bacterium]
MSDRKRDLSFGRYLMSVRLERGISLKAVSNATRIGAETLLAIENEDHDALPAEVFVKGFLRSYARFVGADAEKAVSLYLAQREMVHSNQEAESDLIKARSGFWRRFLMAVAVLLAVMAAALYADQLLHRQPAPVSQEPMREEHAAEQEEGKRSVPAPEAVRAPAAAPAGSATAVTEEETEPAPSAPQSLAAPPAGSGEPAEAPATPEEKVLEASTPESGPEGPAGATAAAPEPTASSPLVLEIEAVEDTWLKVIVDIDEPAEYSLHPGDRLKLEGDKGFNILVGNATGVRLTLNEEPVAVTGTKGQVVNLQLP